MNEREKGKLWLPRPGKFWLWPGKKKKKKKKKRDLNERGR